MKRSVDPLSVLVAFGAVFVLGILLVLGAVSIESTSRASVSDAIVAHFAINSLVVLVALAFAVNAHPYSMHLFHLVGLLIFVCAAGLYQYMAGGFPIAGPVLMYHREIPVACVAVSLWLFGYLVGYYAKGFTTPWIRTSAFLRTFEKPVSIVSVHFSLIVGLLALIYLASLGLVGAFTRAAAYETLSAASSGPLFLINSVFVRALPLLAVAGTALAMRRGKFSLGVGLLIPMFVFEIIGVIATNSPFAAARYWFVAVAVGLSVPHLLAKRKTGVLLLACLIVGLSVLPSIGNARHAESLAEVFRDYLKLDSPFEYLTNSGDVDSFGMMSLAIKWTEIHGPRWGMQSLGAALFWVPRTIWPTKPIGTGAMVTGEMGFDFTNYSVPIMTEPLVDFGLIGIPIFAFVFGWILSSIDRSYWTPFDAEQSPTGIRRIDIIYPFWVGLVLFITRGDLLSSFGYTVGITLALFPFIFVPARVRSRIVQSEDEMRSIRSEWEIRDPDAEREAGR